MACSIRHDSSTARLDGVKSRLDGGGERRSRGARAQREVSSGDWTAGKTGAEVVASLQMSSFAAGRMLFEVWGPHKYVKITGLLMGSQITILLLPDTCLLWRAWLAIAATASYSLGNDMDDCWQDVDVDMHGERR